MDWDEKIRDLWIDFLFWTRYYILNLMYSQRGSGYVASRILRNAAEFADVFVPFYGEGNARRFQELLTRHILLLSELAAIVRTGQNAEEQRTVWYGNASEIAQFLASINPHWDMATWMELLYQRFLLEETLLWRLREEDFRGAIEQFDAAHFNAQQISNYMVEGIAMHFQLPTRTESPLLQPAVQTAP